MVTYQMTLSFVHIYNFVAFTQMNYGMTQCHAIYLCTAMSKCSVENNFR